MTEITRAGLYEMSAEQYHSDPCPEPSLSASIATIISQHSPKHAWFAQRRLNPDFAEKSSPAFDFGRAMHAAVLEPEKEIIQLVEAEDWRTKDAREQKSSIEQAGKIAVLSKQYNEIQLIAATARQFVRSTNIAKAFVAGDKEQTIIAKDDCWLRGRLDCLSKDRKLIIDYKTVRSANPETFLKSSLFSYGYDIQAAMYIYLNKLAGFNGDCDYVWLLQETEAPYSCSLVGAARSVLECGARKLQLARERWINCLKNDSWPSYSNEIFYLDAPAWELAKVEMMTLNSVGV
jgi:hypothetical protein